MRDVEERNGVGGGGRKGEEGEGRLRQQGSARGLVLRRWRGAPSRPIELPFDVDTMDELPYRSKRRRGGRAGAWTFGRE